MTAKSEWLPRLARALLSALVPGAGQLVRGQAVSALLLFAGVVCAYGGTVALLNDRFSLTGRVLSLDFLASPVPLRPPPTVWFLAVIGLAFHGLSVWHAARRSRREPAAS